MLHKFFEEGDWFAPKKFGYGAGWPIAWQGWALLLAYLAIAIGLVTILNLNEMADQLIFYAGLILSTAIFVLIAKRRTKGGWRWRS